MTNTEVIAVKELYSMIKGDLDFFSNLLPILVMDNEEDKTMMKYAIDMVSSINKDMKNVDSMSDLSHILNMKKVCEDYRKGAFPNTTSGYSEFVDDLQTKLLHAYGFTDDGCGGITYEGDDDDLLSDNT